MHDMTPEQELLRPEQQLLTPGEVAKLFRVDPKTVTRWAQNGKIPSVTTPGGHRRFRRSTIIKILTEESNKREN